MEKYFWRVDGKKLILGGKTVSFPYYIKKVRQCDKYIVVMLKYENSDDPTYFSNALFALSKDGEVVWRMEKPEHCQLGMDTLVDFDWQQDKITAYHFSAVRHYLDIDTGRILRTEAGRW